MKGKVLTFAILSALSAGAMAAGYSNSATQGPVGPNTRIPDGAAVVTSPLLVEQQPAATTAAPSASTGSSAYAAPAPSASTGYAAPANPPIATSGNAQIQNAPVVDRRGNVVGEATVVTPSPVWVTRGVAQSGPGTVDKTRPGYPDDNNSHSAWDVGTSSAGG